MKARQRHSIVVPLSALILPAALCLHPAGASAQGTAFTYQGRLNAGTNPVTGLYDFKLDLYNDATGGSAMGGPITNLAVAVTNGLFITLVDFGPGVFAGGSNWLHLAVRTNGGSAFSSLTPRQQVTPTPYALFAESASASGLSGAIPPGDLTGVSGVGLTGVALLAGGNTFSGSQTIDGMLTVSDGGYNTAAPYTDVIIGPGGYNSGESHSINFNDANAPIGSLIVGYENGEGYFAVGNLYNGTYSSGTTAFAVYGTGDVGIGTTAGPQQYLSVHGGVNIDRPIPMPALSTTASPQVTVLRSAPAAVKALLPNALRVPINMAWIFTPPSINGCPLIKRALSKLAASAPSRAMIGSTSKRR